jgi:MFS family permease
VRNLVLLFFCEAFSRTASIVMLSSMALVGQRLAPNPALATLPLALAPVAMMLVTVPAARLMQRRGRKPGFALGTVLGIAGGLVGCLAVFQEHFALLCAGAMGIGAVNGFATYYRFAAGEVVAEDFRSRAISLVMAGGVVAAVTGSNLATWSREWFPEYLFAGSFLSIAVVHGLVLLVLSFVAFPAPSAAEQRAEGRSLREIARQSNFALAVIGAVAAWGIMSLLMNATPLAMNRHLHSFADTAWVIQWHVLGMYVPSFFTGHLIQRFGEQRIMCAGIFLLGGSIAVNLSGIELVHYATGLALLGVGWNFLFVGSTSLLASTHRPEEKARVQSCNDFLVFALMVMTSFGAAPLEGILGWETLNRLAVPLLVAVGVALWVLRRTSRSA